MATRLAVAAVVIGIVAALLVWALRGAPDLDTPAPSPTAPNESPAATVSNEARRPVERGGAARRSSSPGAATATATSLPERRIEGRVIDADGAGVQGARIHAELEPVDVDLDDPSRTAAVVTDGNGRFSVSAPNASVEFQITAESDVGCGGAVAVGRSEVTIRLAPWTSLAGFVTDADGTPIGGAAVDMRASTGNVTFTARAVTRPNGEYALRRVVGPRTSPPPWVRVSVTASGFARASRDTGVAGSAVAGRLDFVLSRGTVLTGVVVDGDTRAPISGARVVWWASPGPAVVMNSTDGVTWSGLARDPAQESVQAEVTTDAEGRFRFERVPTAKDGVLGYGFLAVTTVLARSAGYLPSGSALRIESEAAAQDVTIELWPAGFVEGRVLETDGAPAADVEVAVRVASRGLDGLPAPASLRDALRETVLTDDEGRYRITTCRASRKGPTSVTVFANRRAVGARSASARADVDVAVGETTAAPDLVLEPPAVISATFVVTDAAGLPVAGATIRSDPDDSTVARTDETGRALWSVVRSGWRPGVLLEATKATVRARGYAPQTVTFTPSGDGAPEVPVTLVPGLTISGRVVGADGRPAAGATVRAGPTAALSGADGSFLLSDLPAGEHMITAMIGPLVAGSPYAPHVPVRAAAGATGVVVTLPEPTGPERTSLLVNVTDETGGPVPNVSVRALADPEFAAAVAVGATQFRFARMPRGTVDIGASAPGFTSAMVRGVAVDPDAPPVTIRLVRGVALRGVVRGVEGAGACSVTFTPVAPSPFDAPRTVPLAADRTFSVRGLAPGRHRFVVTATGASGNLLYTATEGGLVDVAARPSDEVLEFRVARAGRLVVAVGDPRFPPTHVRGNDALRRFGAAARVEVSDATDALVATWSPVTIDGKFDVALPPGDYVVRLLVAGEETRTMRATVAAGLTSNGNFPRRPPPSTEPR